MDCVYPDGFRWIIFNLTLSFPLLFSHLSRNEQSDWVKFTFLNRKYLSFLYPFLCDGLKNWLVTVWHIFLFLLLTACGLCFIPTLLNRKRVSPFSLLDSPLLDQYWGSIVSRYCCSYIFLPLFFFSPLPLPYFSPLLDRWWNLFKAPSLSLISPFYRAVGLTTPVNQLTVAIKTFTLEKFKPIFPHSRKPPGRNLLFLFSPFSPVVKAVGFRVPHLYSSLIPTPSSLVKGNSPETDQYGKLPFLFPFSRNATRQQLHKILLFHSQSGFKFWVLSCPTQDAVIFPPLSSSHIFLFSSSSQLQAR